jgi:hypothetical protein
MQGFFIPCCSLRRGGLNAVIKVHITLTPSFTCLADLSRHNAESIIKRQVFDVKICRQAKLERENKVKAAVDERLVRAILAATSISFIYSPEQSHVFLASKCV